MVIQRRIPFCNSVVKLTVSLLQYYSIISSALSDKFLPSNPILCNFSSDFDVFLNTNFLQHRWYMNSPLLPQFFHKYRFYLSVFCCFHVVSGSQTDRLSNVCHIVIGYRNGKLLNVCCSFVCLFVSEDSLK